ncbi:MAG: hypothetical protein ACE5JM_00085 [Armatimonadota bacterium]
MLRASRRLTAALVLWVLTTGAVTAEVTSGLHPYPLWPSTPVPGWPGLEADKKTSREKLADLGGGVAQYGQPEFLAYPGSVEHIRRELQRYVPPYPVYNARTLRKNFILNEMPEYADRCVKWAEPVYYNPMYRARVRTRQKRAPVRAFPWKPNGDPIALDLGRLEPSLYALRVIASAPEQKTVQPKKYVFLRLRINDLPGDTEAMNAYILRAQVLDNFYAIQEFFFQSRGDRQYRAELALLPESERRLLVYNIDLHDDFAECAGRSGKTRTTLFDVDDRRKLWAEMRREYPDEAQWAERIPEEQRAYDDLVWQHWLPPLNCHTSQNLGTGKYDRGDWHRDKWCFAPDEWERLTETPAVDAANDPLRLSRRDPLVFRVAQPKMYLDVRGNLHPDLPRYEIQGGDYYRAGKALAPVEECTVRDGVLFEGETKLGPASRLEVRDATLLEDGVPVGQAARFYGKPGARYYDKEGRLEFASEISLAPGLYYDADAITAVHRDAWRSDFVKQRRGLGAWHQLGNRQAARDEAIRFIRYIYDWPALRPSRQLNNIMGDCGLDRRFYRRYQWHPAHHELLSVYDSLFEFIDGNDELAAAVGRYLPWIKTPDDVIALIDTRLVQDYANDMMHYRYYYDHGQARLMMTAVLVQDDRAITDPWMEFLWRRGWEYPQAMSGLADNFVTSIGRDGGTNVGSIFYGIGGQLDTVRLMEEYMGKGGNAKYDLSDPLQYPDARATIYLPFESAAAGRHVLGIGDVGGPSCAYGRLVHLPKIRDIMAAGWRWTRDPKFAYDLANTFGRADEPEEEWAAILEAAETTRDPYLMNRSRVLADWGGYLEGGYEEDDFRFKRSVSVRVGNGQGHAHSDTLDLRLWAHGITMSGDLGMRPAYGKPRHQRSRVHNVIEVDGQDWNSHAWVRHLFDAPGAPYMAAESVAPEGMEHVTLFRRQCALIDVDPGVPSRQTPPQEDPNVVTPSSYVFDVFRVSGGAMHTYCFHGCVDDGFEANVKNRVDMTGREGDPDEDYLRGFAWSENVEDPKPDDVEWAADPADDTLVATWRVSRGPGEYGGAPESRMYSGLYGKHGGAMTEPRKYTRLHLFNQTGNRILHGICMDRVLVKEHNPPFPGYAGRCLFAQKRGREGDSLESAFAAVIEPYAGEPFVTSARVLPVEESETDALRAVAVEVRTGNGHTDLCFADGRPDKVRTVALAAGAARVSAEYAYLSVDADGLRQAVLTGGRLLESRDVKIEVQDLSYGGKVTEVDYINRRVTIDGRVPGRRFVGRFFEVGGDFHKTSYQVSDVAPANGRTMLTLRKGIEIMRSHVKSSDPAAGTVKTQVAMLRFRGRDRDLTASNESLTRFWRAQYVGGNRHEGHDFLLTGAPVTERDFAEGSVLRIWEFGVGDSFRIRTGVSLRRVSREAAHDVYEVMATSPFTITLAGQGMSVSRDKTEWRGLEATADDGAVRAEIGEDLIDAGVLYIRVQR